MSEQKQPNDCVDNEDLLSVEPKPGSVYPGGAIGGGLDSVEVLTESENAQNLLNKAGLANTAVPIFIDYRKADTSTEKVQVLINHGLDIPKDMAAGAAGAAIAGRVITGGRVLTGFVGASVGYLGAETIGNTEAWHNIQQNVGEFVNTRIHPYVTSDPELLNEQNQARYSPEGKVINSIVGDFQQDLQEIIKLQAGVEFLEMDLAMMRTHNPDAIGMSVHESELTANRVLLEEKYKTLIAKHEEHLSAIIYQDKLAQSFALIEEINKLSATIEGTPEIMEKALSTMDPDHVEYGGVPHDIQDIAREPLQKLDEALKQLHLLDAELDQHESSAMLLATEKVINDLDHQLAAKEAESTLISRTKLMSNTKTDNTRIRYV